MDCLGFHFKQKVSSRARCHFVKCKEAVFSKKDFGIGLSWLWAIAILSGTVTNSFEIFFLFFFWIFFLIGSGLELAKIILNKNDLRDVTTTIHLSRVVFWRIKLNFFWALDYNLISRINFLFVIAINNMVSEKLFQLLQESSLPNCTIFFTTNHWCPPLKLLQL